MTGTVAIWKEIESKIPSLQDILYSFFKFEDGTGSFIPRTKSMEDERNEKSLFIQKKKLDGKDGDINYIDPSIKELLFTNDNGSLLPSTDKKKLFITWKGEMKCQETASNITCAPFGTDDISPPQLKKESFREKEPTKKILKRKEQERGNYSFNSKISVWSDPKTIVKDINVIALASGATAAVAGSFLGYFLPVSAIFAVSAPMLIGAPILANGEAQLRNLHGSWFFDQKLDEDRWFSEIEIDPSLIKDIKVKQDDEYYFHADIDLAKPVSCSLKEESDLLSYYPKRRFLCNEKIG